MRRYGDGGGAGAACGNTLIFRASAGTVGYGPNTKCATAPTGARGSGVPLCSPQRSLAHLPRAAAEALFTTRQQATVLPGKYEVGVVKTYASLTKSTRHIQLWNYRPVTEVDATRGLIAYLLRI